MSDIDLRHGDCLEIMPSIPDGSIDMIFCDLPYGMTACKWDVVIPFDKLWVEYNRVIKKGGCIALFGSEPFSSYLRMSNIKNYKYDWIWVKGKASNMVMAKTQPLRISELISIFNKHNYYPQKEPVLGKIRNIKKERENKKWLLVNRPSDVNHFKKIKYSATYDPTTTYPKNLLYFPNHLEKDKKMHPTQKPVALLEYLINTYSNENETILDNCMGSGSTGVACIQQNRKFIGIEKELNYFNIAKKRINDVVNSHNIFQ